MRQTTHRNRSDALRDGHLVWAPERDLRGFIDDMECSTSDRQVAELLGVTFPCPSGSFIEALDLAVCTARGLKYIRDEEQGESC